LDLYRTCKYVYPFTSIIKNKSLIYPEMVSLICWEPLTTWPWCPVKSSVKIEMKVTPTGVCSGGQEGPGIDIKFWITRPHCSCFITEELNTAVLNFWLPKNAAPSEVVSRTDGLRMGNPKMSAWIWSRRLFWDRPGN